MVAPSTVPANAVGQLGMLNARGVEEDVFPVTPKGVRIGRGVQMGNDIILDDSMVSKKHCHITYENGSFLLGDDNSTNGTYLNEMPVRAGSQVPLRSGDTIRLGTTRLCFKTITKAPAQGQPPTVPTPRTPPVADSVEEWNQAETRFDFSHAQKNRAPSPVAFRLIGENGELYPLASKMTIGRALTGDITLIGEGVASQHARLTIDDGALYVEDLGTTGGTFVNGEQIPANFPVVLYNGDRLVCGSVSLLVEKFVIGKDS
jgi:pSer/pThr/pTyr-binding forkhead associated (FHA) protein